MLPCLCRKTRSGRAVLFVGSVFCRRRQDFRRALRHCDKSGCACSRKAGKKELSSPEGKCLLLDGLQDPANVGAVLRTAAASGYDDVYLCGCADPFRRKACVRECPRSMFSIFSRAKGKKYSICFPAVSLYAPICRAKTYLPPTLRKSTRWFSAAKAAASAAPRVCGAKKP